MTDEQKDKLRPIFSKYKPHEWKELYDKKEISFEEMIFLYRQQGKLDFKKSLDDQAKQLIDHFGGEIIK